VATLAEVQAAHEVLYRVLRAGVWSRRAGAACVLLGAFPLLMLLLGAVGTPVVAGSWHWRELATLLTVSAMLGAGGALLVRGGHAMAHIVGTREAERIRRACALAALGAGLASLPAAWTVLGVGFALLGLVQRNGPVALFPSVYVGCCCLAPAAVPLPLTAVNGLLWLRLPAVVARIHEGREALRGAPLGTAFDGAPPPPPASPP
jgi:hypothetical protein